MFLDEEVTSEDEEEMIHKAADTIHDYGMDIVAVLFLQSLKPLTYVGGQLGRFMISPFLLFLGGDIRRSGETLFTTFEKRNNVEKLITLLEEKAETGGKRAKNERARERVKEEAPPKKGWRRFLPF